MAARCDTCGRPVADCVQGADQCERLALAAVRADTALAEAEARIASAYGAPGFAGMAEATDAATDAARLLATPGAVGDALTDAMLSVLGFATAYAQAQGQADADDAEAHLQAWADVAAAIAQAHPGHPLADRVLQACGI